MKFQIKKILENNGFQFPTFDYGKKGDYHVTLDFEKHHMVGPGMEANFKTVEELQLILDNI